MLCPIWDLRSPIGDNIPNWGYRLLVLYYFAIEFGFGANGVARKLIHQTSPIPKEYAHRQRQSHFWKLCRGKSSVDGNWSVQPELPSNPPWLYTFYRGTADQNWFNVVVFYGGIQVCTELSCLKTFPLHNFQNKDCLCILAHTFGIGFVLQMRKLAWLNMHFLPRNS